MEMPTLSMCIERGRPSAAPDRRSFVPPLKTALVILVRRRRRTLLRPHPSSTGRRGAHGQSVLAHVLQPLRHRRRAHAHQDSFEKKKHADDTNRKRNRETVDGPTRPVFTTCGTVRRSGSGVQAGGASKTASGRCFLTTPTLK